MLIAAASRSWCKSFNRLVHAREHLGRYFEPERPGGLHIEHGFVFQRRPDRQIDGTLAVEDAVDVVGSFPIGLDLVGARLFGEWSEAWGRQAAKILLGTDVDFDAVFCGSDQIARGVAESLRAAGRRVPDDVALVGFDNWDVMALACQPPLTSVDMELQTLGRTAADLLLAAINGEPAPGRHTRPCRLVIRDSTAVNSPG